MIGHRIWRDFRVKAPFANSSGVVVGGGLILSNEIYVYKCGASHYWPDMQSVIWKNEGRDQTEGAVEWKLRLPTSELFNVLLVAWLRNQHTEWKIADYVIFKKY